MYDLEFSMRLNQASDFALRIMMHLARQKTPITVDDIAQQLGLVTSHTMKIVAKLVKANLLHSRRGRSGGVSLGKPCDRISVGDVVRVIEADFAIVECMRMEGSSCVMLPSCKLRGVMYQAHLEFMAVLDDRSIKSIITP